MCSYLTWPGSALQEVRTCAEAIRKQAYYHASTFMVASQLNRPDYFISVAPSNPLQNLPYIYIYINVALYSFIGTEAHLLSKTKKSEYVHSLRSEF